MQQIKLNISSLADERHSGCASPRFTLFVAFHNTAMDNAKGSIGKAFNYDKREYESVFKIIDARWTDQLHQTLHAEGHILNPRLYHKKK